MILSHIPFSRPGFVIQQVTEVEGHLCMTATATNNGAPCPTCGETSRSIHSWYQRHPHDLPNSGRAVQLSLHVRRFRCRNKACPRQTFALSCSRGCPSISSADRPFDDIAQSPCHCSQCPTSISFIGSLRCLHQR